jgi:TubC N-terminal docking domain
VSLLSELEARGLSLFVEGGGIKIRGRRSAITDEVRELVRSRKGDLIQELFEREERAALMGGPEDSTCDDWSRVVHHPAVLALLEAFAPCGVSIVSVTSARERREEAA